MGKYIPEKDVKEKVNRFLKKWVPCFSFFYSAYYGVAGIPDKIVVQDGKFIGIELKKTPVDPDGKTIQPSPAQVLCHKKLIENGAVVIVVNEHDPIAQLKREFDFHGIRYEDSKKKTVKQEKRNV